MKDDGLLLIHIRECISRIERYAAAGAHSFLTDTLVQDAVLRNLQTLAESATRLSPALKATQPRVDWRGIAGLRNVVTHDYLGLQLDWIWQTLIEDLPPLKKAVEEMLTSLPPAQPPE